jgi:hypothetical protein
VTVTVRVDTGVGLVGDVTLVRALGMMSSMGGGVIGTGVVVASDGFLHFVEKARHD